jgi:glutamate formiminotransferase
MLKSAGDVLKSQTAPTIWANVINVYVSEGRNQQLLNSMRLAAGQYCVHQFSDECYNRTGFTLSSRFIFPVQAALLRLCGVALQQLDLRLHDATHPRLGVVDHVSVHSVLAESTDPHDSLAASAALECAAALAVNIGISLSGMLPVYFYGAALESKEPLDQVRRSLGYFRSSNSALPTAIHRLPDLGPSTCHPRHGLVCVGALPWVVNFNLVLDWANNQFPPRDRNELLIRARKVAAVVSAHRGGPIGCQSLALPHANGTVEVACNLLAPQAPDTATVRVLVENAAHTEGLRVVRHYTTGLSPEEIWKITACGDSDGLL